MNEDRPKVRLDKWLWAARFFKTRGLAATAIDSGKIQVAGARVKRSRLVQAGDEISIRLGAFDHIVTVRRLSERRGPAAVAVTLYEELPASRKAREDLQLQMKAAAPVFGYDQGKPTKKQRRDIERMRRTR